MDNIAAAGLNPTQLESMVHNKAVGTEAKLKEVSVQFESIMLREYLNTSLKPLLEGQLGNSTGGHVYQGMIIDQMADTLARSGQFGVGEAFFQELKGIVPADEQANPTAQLQSLLGNQQMKAQIDAFATEPEEEQSQPSQSETTPSEDAAQIQSLYQLWAQKGML